MRFDDSLETVLSADMSSPFGAQLAWRQLVDLIGRGRVAATDDVIGRLRTIRSKVAPPVRSASARAIAAAAPPLALVVLFAEDEIAVAAPVLRSAQLAAGDWAELLPLLSPTARSILRHRRDLSPDVMAMLAGFGSVDFVLASPGGVEAVATAEYVWAWTATGDADAAGQGPVETDLGPLIVAMAAGPAVTPTGDAASRSTESTVQDTPSAADGPFEIAEMVKRINAYNRNRAKAPPVGSGPAADVPGAADAPDSAIGRFHFETDSAGLIRWVEGVSRNAVIGLSLASPLVPDVRSNADAALDGSGVDAAVAHAFRERRGFTDLRLVIAGHSNAAGAWRISAVPAFDYNTGHFIGYRGSARRPRTEQTVEPQATTRSAAADALRQLVHELRTPTNAIAGFAEMIETEMLGPVPDIYRAQAATIRTQTAGLLGAIEDIDTAARIETDALQLRADIVPVAPLLDRVATDLAPLAALRGTTLEVSGPDPKVCIRGDERAVERLIGRLLATLVAVAKTGERIGITVAQPSPDRLAMVFDRPRALADYVGEALLTIAPDVADAEGGGPLLGTGFALRLTRNLAIELGGGLVIGGETLTLHLPVAISDGMEQGSHN